MSIPVILSIRGRQNYAEQELEEIELVTEGELEAQGEGWRITYEESDLTGLAGVTTTFLVQPGVITLQRKGPLSSEMVFREGMFHESLYRMEFGALMVTVCASKVTYDLSSQGGTIDLTYAIEIEQSAAGFIEYHLEIKTK